MKCLYLFVGVVVFGDDPDHAESVHHRRNGFNDHPEPNPVRQVLQMTLHCVQKPAPHHILCKLQGGPKRHENFVELRRRLKAVYKGKFCIGAFWPEILLSRTQFSTLCDCSGVTY